MKTWLIELGTNVLGDFVALAIIIVIVCYLQFRRTQLKKFVGLLFLPGLLLLFFFVLIRRGLLLD